MPHSAAQMMMKATASIDSSKKAKIIVFLYQGHRYTTEHVVTPGDPEAEYFSDAAILPAQMISAFKPRYL